ncbi:MAG: DUF4339 domain-containing protein [Muribaculaceae bacterium]|nr:DUF4339 domain-containing protein [Muribaculaceae bacterium]
MKETFYNMPQDYETMKYFLHIDGQQKGPFEIVELRDHGMTADTPVWCEGMAEWTRAGEVQDLAWLFAPIQANPPKYNNPVPAHNPQPESEPAPVQPEPVYEETPRCRSGLALAIINLCSPFIMLLVILLAAELFPYVRDNAGRISIFIAVLTAMACTVLGVISLIFAIQSKAAYGRGDYVVSSGKGQAARILGWIGILLMIVSIAVIMIVCGTSVRHYYGYY